MRKCHSLPQKFSTLQNNSIPESWLPDNAPESLRRSLGWALGGYSQAKCQKCRLTISWFHRVFNCMTCRQSLSFCPKAAY
jgi:hypothetical protein